VLATESESNPTPSKHSGAVRCTHWAEPPERSKDMLLSLERHGVPADHCLGTGYLLERYTQAPGWLVVAVREMPCGCAVALPGVLRVCAVPSAWRSIRIPAPKHPLQPPSPLGRPHIRPSLLLSLSLPRSLMSLYGRQQSPPGGTPTPVGFTAPAPPHV